jgi:hypothetical protein
MMLFLSLLRLLGGSLESKEAEQLLKRMSGLDLFRDCLFLGIENSRCSVNVSRFLEKYSPLFII